METSFKPVSEPEFARRDKILAPLVLFELEKANEGIEDFEDIEDTEAPEEFESDHCPRELRVPSLIEAAAGLEAKEEADEGTMEDVPEAGVEGTGKDTRRFFSTSSRWGEGLMP